MLAIVMSAIAGMFIIYLLAKGRLALSFCVLCAAVSTTWLILLVLYKTGHFHNAVLVTLLMGQSVTGIFYYVQRRVTNTLKVFSLPFFLTLTVGAYFLISGLSGSLPVLVLLLSLWVAGYIIFAYRNDPGKKMVVNAVIDCCKEK